MFDGHRQGQTIALQYSEQKRDSSSFYEDGHRIMSRPDRADVDTEYEFYTLKIIENYQLSVVLNARAIIIYNLNYFYISSFE